MKKLLLIAFACLAVISCNKVSKMADLANLVKVECDPEILEVVADNIDADVTVTFPAKYFHKKAILEVVPVMKFDGQEVAGEPFVYQGEKVMDNYKTVGKDGASITEHVQFKYVPGMEKSELVGRATVKYKKKSWAFPEDIKIADGANTTYMLANKTGSYAAAADNYQDVIPEEVEAQILYLINSANVRSNQLTSESIKEYKTGVKDVMKDDRRTITGTDIIAYASPDGPEKRNNVLSDQRAASAKSAFKQVSNKLETGGVTTRSIGEDWEGFQELVNNSNIEDKDLILRVLSMYSDPDVREREIKNMSSVYGTLAKDVLPELRRARFVTNVEFQNYTAEELKALVEDNIDILDEEALLRSATLTDDQSAKLDIYHQAIKKYDSDRAKLNSACIMLDQGKDAMAETFLKKVSDTAVEGYNNLRGVLALRNGDLAKALDFFEKETGDASKVNLGTMDILNGNYAAAAKKLAGTGDVNEALAYILNGDLTKASSLLKDNDCELAAYERAIIAARQGKASVALSELAKIKNSKDLKDRAENDIEFAKIK
ncbi:MAG: hypothetical protein J5801_03300 [Bacteroidales bacterium]|nr:hypothetical protein [Bacteroidales bacterium]